MKFRILSKVSGIRLKGVRYAPGDVVDLPESYLGETYLEPVPEPSLTPIPLEEKLLVSGMGMPQEKAAELTPPEKPRQRRSKKDA
jgi:hypothetical protein